MEQLIYMRNITHIIRASGTAPYSSFSLGFRMYITYITGSHQMRTKHEPTGVQLKHEFGPDNYKSAKHCCDIFTHIAENRKCIRLGNGFVELIRIHWKDFNHHAPCLNIHGSCDRDVISYTREEACDTHSCDHQGVIVLPNSVAPNDGN